jgi:hypothetical protein
MIALYRTLLQTIVQLAIVYALYTRCLLLTVLGRKKKHFMSGQDADGEDVFFGNSESEDHAWIYWTDLLRNIFFLDICLVQDTVAVYFIHLLSIPSLYFKFNLFCALDHKIWSYLNGQI